MQVLDLIWGLTLSFLRNAFSKRDVICFALESIAMFGGAEALVSLLN